MCPTGRPLRRGIKARLGSRQLVFNDSIIKIDNVYLPRSPKLSKKRGLEVRTSSPWTYGGSLALQIAGDVHLLLGVVDLHARPEQPPHLNKALYRGEVASGGTLLPADHGLEVGRRDALLVAPPQLRRHEHIEELDLHPARDHTLCQKDLKRRGVLTSDLLSHYVQALGEGVLCERVPGRGRVDE